MDKDQDQELLERMDQMVEDWGSPFVTRSLIGKFSGGLLNSGTLSKMDSQGKGIPKRVYCMGKAAYFVSDVVEFIQKMSKSDWQTKTTPPDGAMEIVPPEGGNE